MGGITEVAGSDVVVITESDVVVATGDCVCVVESCKDELVDMASEVTARVVSLSAVVMGFVKVVVALSSAVLVAKFSVEDIVVERAVCL